MPAWDRTGQEVQEKKKEEMELHPLTVARSCVFSHVCVYIYVNARVVCTLRGRVSATGGAQFYTNFQNLDNGALLEYVCVRSWRGAE